MRSPDPVIPLARLGLDEAGCPLVPAGWYRDSVDEKLHRYWDGGEWRPVRGEYPQRRGLARVEEADPHPTATTRWPR